MPPRSAPMIEGLLAALYDGLDRSRIDSVLGEAERELGEIVRDWPSWARSLLDLLEAAEGRTGAGGGDARPGDPTLSALLRREPLTRDRSDVLGYLDDALYALKQARTRMAGLVRTAGAQQLQADLARGRCTGGMGLPRSERWGDESCTALAVRRGMCWKHYEACLDDEREHNMSTVRQFG